MTRVLNLAFTAAYGAIVLLFLACGVYLVGVAASSAWEGLASPDAPTQPASMSCSAASAL